MAEGRIYLSSVIKASKAVDHAQSLSSILCDAVHGNLLAADMVKNGHGAWKKRPKTASVHADIEETPNSSEDVDGVSHAPMEPTEPKKDGQFVIQKGSASSLSDCSRYFSCSGRLC